MILYLDTSSLVKLYVTENGSEQIHQMVASAYAVATCRIALPEFYSALTRRFNNREISLEDYQLVSTSFDADWNRLYSLDFDEVKAGQLVCRHGLRGADAIHLASALLLMNTGNEVELVFASADNKLNEAAAKEGFKVI